MQDINLAFWGNYNSSAKPIDSVTGTVKSLQDRVTDIMIGILNDVYNMANSADDVIGVTVLIGQKELTAHSEKLEAFRNRILAGLAQQNGDTSPRKQILQTIGKDRHKDLLKTHPLTENELITRELDKAKSMLETTQRTIKKITDCWNLMQSLTKENEPAVICEKVSQIKNKLKELKPKIQLALLHGTEENIDLTNITNRKELIKLSEKFLIKNEYDNFIKIIKRILSLNPTDSERAHIDALEASQDVPYRKASMKIGELHGSLLQKNLELTSLEILKPYFSEELNELSDQVRNRLIDISKELVKIAPKKRDTRPLRTAFKEESIPELKISARVLTNQIINAKTPEECRNLWKKFHDCCRHLPERYKTTFAEEHFSECIKMLGSESFIELIKQCKNLMLALREEQAHHADKNVEADALMKVGFVTGKTTMITDYNTAIKEILLQLNTFLTNSLHMLVEEILKIFPTMEGDYQEMLLNTFTTSTRALIELDQTILTNSEVMKK